jgi:voltage-gated potassium channel
MIGILLRIFGQPHRKHVVILLCSALGCMLIGATLFSVTQQLPFGRSVYWAITTATTVGYGDVTPKNPAGEVIASATMLTTIPLLAGVFALLTGAAAANGIRRILAMRHTFPEGAYRVVIGSDPSVPAILEELVQVGEDVVLVADVDPDTVPARVHVVRGDPTEPAILAAARPQGARQGLITGTSDGDVLVSAVLLRRIAPNLPLVALVRSQSVREALADLGVLRTMSASGMIAHTLAKSLEAPHAADMLAQLVESNQHTLTEVQADQATVGKPLSAVRDERDGLVLGLVHEGKFQLGIGEDLIVASGDSLLLAEPQRGESHQHAEPVSAPQS